MIRQSRRWYSMNADGLPRCNPGSRQRRRMERVTARLCLADSGSISGQEHVQQNLLGQPLARPGPGCKSEVREGPRDKSLSRQRESSRRDRIQYTRGCRNGILHFSRYSCKDLLPQRANVIMNEWEYLAPGLDGGLVETNEQGGEAHGRMAAAEPA